MGRFYMNVCHSGCCQTLVKHESEMCGPTVACACNRVCEKCREFEMVLETRTDAKTVAMKAVRFIEELCAEGELKDSSPTQMWRGRRQKMKQILQEAKDIGLV